MTWVNFPIPDCEMQDMWRRNYSEWLPTSGYDLVGDIWFEMYYGISDQQTSGEIWFQ